MYYTRTDESDATGKYYANFYGGILIRSEHLNDVLERFSAITIYSCIYIRKRHRSVEFWLEFI